MIKKVAFTVYPVKDIQVSRNFYEKLLGLTCTESFGDFWFEYDVGGTCFAITSYALPSYPPGTQSSLAFEVDDLDEIIKKIEKQGIKQALDRIESPVCRSAFFNDPSGNVIALHQLKN